MLVDFVLQSGTLSSDVHVPGLVSTRVKDDHFIKLCIVERFSVFGVLVKFGGYFSEFIFCQCLSVYIFLLCF